MPLRAHALILAAGQGRRFGGGKLHALYRGRPLLSYVLDVVGIARTRGLLDGGHVVVAAGDERALTLARAYGLDAVINDAPELGLSHSVQLGLAELEAGTINETGAALVFLGDQPLVRIEVVEALVTKGGSIVRPRYQARPDAPGHPVLLARSIWARALQLEGDRGFGALLDSSSPEAVTLDVTGDNPDVDTLADLNALEGFSRPSIGLRPVR
jgi:CTP:molybdopterin cytidylyltransferase MocA